MNSRITPAETALLMPFSSAPEVPDAARVRALVAEARRARDAALAARIKGFFHGLRAVMTALRQRRETIEQLRALSDRELNDIGLNRAGIAAAATQAVPLPANDAATPQKAA